MSTNRTPPSLAAAHTNLSDYADGEVENLELIRRRAAHVGGSLLFYHDPVCLVRGEGACLFDQHGREYLDCYNNVPSVGHCNPRVVEALSTQAHAINTHTRYLHPQIIDYAESLAATLPEGLDVCFFVCTGSEANDLAIQMARSATGQRGTIVMEYAYHGNTTLVAELSTASAPPEGPPPHVVAVEPPNLYRGPFRSVAESEWNCGLAYAELIDEAIEALEERGAGAAAFLCDAIFDSQGGLEAPRNYFAEAYARVRGVGGLVIADEVQAGFGRTGTMWGFEQYGVVPDIVTMGKPMGNGHPMAAVVTSREIAARFAENSFYFNTFGGNPVSAAVGQAVLDEIEDGKLLEEAQAKGAYLRTRLEALAEAHPQIGDVRGRGLYQALELVQDRSTLVPAAELSRLLPDRLKEEGVLIGLSGRYGNVLKIRPPLVITQDQIDALVATLDAVLGEVTEKKT